MTRSTVLVFSLWLFGCSHSEPLPQNVSSTVALCSAGYGVKLSADLAAQVEAVEMGAEISASLERTLKGLVFAGADLSDANTLIGYEGYLDCVQQRRQREDFVLSLKSRRDLVLRVLGDRGHTEVDLKRLRQAMDQHIAATEAGQLQRAHELHNQINLELLSLGVGGDDESGPMVFYDP